jgi:hypothetical protein
VVHRTKNCCVSEDGAGSLAHRGPTQEDVMRPACNVPKRISSGPLYSLHSEEIKMHTVFVDKHGVAWLMLFGVGIMLPINKTGN